MCLRFRVAFCYAVGMSAPVPASFTEVVTLIGRARLADELGVAQHTPRDWSRRNAIPPGWWSEVVTVAARFGHQSITLELLADLARKQRLVA